MVNDLLVALMQQTPEVAPAAAEAANKWLTMQFSIGDLTSVGTMIAAYVALRERLTRLETQVEPLWRAWNLRKGERRED